jgi:hypothetical protein
MHADWWISPCGQLRQTMPHTLLFLQVLGAWAACLLLATLRSHTHHRWVVESTESTAGLALLRPVLTRRDKVMCTCAVFVVEGSPAFVCYRRSRRFMLQESAARVLGVISPLTCHVLILCLAPAFAAGSPG